jgi:hypothetical protein
LLAVFCYVTLSQIKKIMKNLLIIIAIISITQIAFAQTTIGIYGKVATTAKKPIEGITVLLLNDHKEVIAKILTNVNGDYGFDIEKEGIYGIEVVLTDSTSQQITNVLLKKESQYYNFLISNQSYLHDKNINLLSAQEIEKMPTQDVTKMMETKGNFDKDANGKMRSRTLGNGVRVIIDGQIMTDNSAIRLIPGSIGSMEVLKR